MKKIMSFLLVLALMSLGAVSIVNSQTVVPSQASALKTLGLSKAPKTVACTTVSSTRLAYALGLPIVAIPQTSSSLPDSIKNLPALGSSMSPSIEKIVAANADLVLCEIIFKESLEPKLKEFKIPYYFVDCNTLENVTKQVGILGAAFGKSKEAQAILNDFTTRSQIAEKKSAGKIPPKVMILFGSPDSYMIGGTNTFVGDLVRRMNGVNITTIMKLRETTENGGFLPLSQESAIAANPDIILCIGHGSAEMQAAFEKNFTKNPAWSYVNAIKNKRIVYLDSNLFGTNGGIHAIESLESLAKIMYP